MKKIFYTFLACLISTCALAQEEEATEEKGYQGPTEQLLNISATNYMYTADGADATFVSGIIGAETHDSDYEYHGGVKSLQFDKESGFTIKPIDPDNPTNFLISLGSSWTELIPNITNQTILPNYKGVWKPQAYDTDDIVGPLLTDGTSNFWVAISPTTEEDVPGQSEKWIVHIMPGNLRPSGEEKLAIKIVETNQTGTFWDYSNTNKNEKTLYIGINKDSLSGNVPYENVYVSENIEVANLKYPIGKYENGSVIEMGTPLNVVFNNMFRRTVYPVYTNPTMTLTFTPKFTSENGNNYFETGEIFSSTKLTTTVKTNDSGKITQYKYLLGDSEKHTSDSSQTTDTWTLEFDTPTTTRSTFYVRVSYDQGPVKQDSEGHDYETGRIEAGTITNSVAINPSRYVFYKTSPQVEKLVINTNTLSKMDKRFFSPIVQSGFEFNLPSGTRQIVLALPDVYYVSTFTVKDREDPSVNDSLLESSSISLFRVSPFYCLNGYKNDTANNSYLVYHYDSPNIIEKNTIYVVIKFSLVTAQTQLNLTN